MKNIQTFCYVDAKEAEKMSPVTNPKLPFQLADVKLHASRTSLMMQRSIATSNIMPNNAMNTHDTLVVKPCEMKFILKAVPFKLHNKKETVFDSTAGVFELGGEIPNCLLSSAEKSMGKRMRQSAPKNNLSYAKLTLSEYQSILQDEISLSEEEIKAHCLVLKSVNESGVTGITEEDCRSLLLKDHFTICNRFDMIIQTLVNFAMIYSVGKYVKRYVSQAYFGHWYYTPPSTTQGTIAEGPLYGKTELESLSSRKSSTDVESPIVLDDTLESSFEGDRGSELKSPVAEKGNGGSSTCDTSSKSSNAACEEAVHFDVSESTQGTSNDVQGKSKKSHQRKETKKVPQKR